MGTMRASVGMPFIPRNPKGKCGSVKRRATAAQQRKAMDTVKQLRKEVGLKRLPVSVTVRDIVKYVGQQSSQDFLLSGGNDFKKTTLSERKLCLLYCACLSLF